MHELINLKESTDTITVSGRDLHEFLEVGTPYQMWFPRMIEYGFSENQDFCTNLFESTGGRPATDHQLTIDMAKEIAMLQRTEKGKQARQYFLDVEKRWNSPEATMARALQFSQKTIESARIENRSLKLAIESQRPKVLFADSVAGSSTSINVGVMAKLLNQNGIDTGEKRFYQWLREHGYVISKKGRTYNDPTQKSLELKIMEIKESTRLSASGSEPRTDKTTLITGKGQQYFIDRFLSSKAKGVAI